MAEVTHAAAQEETEYKLTGCIETTVMVVDTAFYFMKFLFFEVCCDDNIIIIEYAVIKKGFNELG